MTFALYVEKESQFATMSGYSLNVHHNRPPDLRSAGHRADRAATGSTTNSLRKTKPTAIVCANDIMAFGATRFIESMGLEIGTDISLTGYDDTPVAELIDLTSIGQPIALIANHIILEPSLVVRESSARPRKTK